MLIFMLILLLSEGQTGEACEPPNKAVHLWILGSIAQNIMSYCFNLPRVNILFDTNCDLFLDLASYLSPADFLTIHLLSSLSMK
jgi:hypothetical protein